MSTLTLTEAMISAVTNGISIIPLRANKRPGVPEWRPYITEIAQLDEVNSWAKHFEGFAILGGTSARLEILDFEEIFCRDYWPQFLVALADAELYATFDNWLRGYCVTTPRSGLHVAVHVDGNDEPPGNTKLAMDEDGKTLAETRGHGGYAVAAPSGGNIHPNGGQWQQLHGGFDTIEWTTLAEWEAVCSVIASFGVPIPVRETTSQAPGSVSLSQLERSSSWIDATTKPRMADVISSYGWTYGYASAKGEHWARPTKDPRKGVSATINLNDRLMVFSSNAHPVPLSVNNQTYDVVDVIGCYELGHLPDQSERTEIMRRWRGAPPPAEGGQGDSADPSIYLPESFWQATEWLQQLYAVAVQRQRSPEALLGATLAAYSLITPMPFKVPAIVGVQSPLNMYVALVSRSGRGKTSAMQLAKHLVGVPNSADYLTDGLRSGEGLIAMARISRPRGEEASGPSFRRGIQVDVDEITNLQAVRKNQGGSAMAYMSSAWSGLGNVGGYKAAGQDSFPADLVRVCCVMGVQFRVAGDLFTGESASQGFPGRFMYFGLENPLIAQLEVDATLASGAPERLDLRPYTYDEARKIEEIAFPDHVIIAAKKWDLSLEERSPIDGHRMLLRLRTAALLALMSGHVYVDDETWNLSGQLETHSIAMRDALQEAVRSVDPERARAAGYLDYEREKGRNDAWAQERARKLAWRVHEGEDSSYNVARRRFNSVDRKRFDDIVDYARARGWIIIKQEGAARVLLPGESSPKPGGTGRGD